jgi:hypothetical protein
MTGPRKPRRASWRELPPAEMAAHLLATPTISDGAWTSEPRLPRETRSDFVRRVLLGETPEFEPETPEAEAAELAGRLEGPTQQPAPVAARPSVGAPPARHRAGRGSSAQTRIRRVQQCPYVESTTGTNAVSAGARWRMRALFDALERSS